MKKLMMLGVLLCACSSYGYYGWGIYGSYWKPSDADGSFAPGLKITIEMVPSVQLELRGSYFNNIKADGDREVELRVVPLEAGLALSLPVAKVHKVYGGGGFSYFLTDAKEGPSVDDEVGGYAVAGFEFAVTPNAALFCEGKYNFVKMNEGLEMGGPGLNAGLLITW
ncbi:MAG: hypothetical protein V2A34_02130 [Lentisphaerota bacterium]